MHSRYLLPILAILIGQISILNAGQLPEKHPLDKSESRTLVLDNGLKVLLVSDPELNMSAASMAVDVGSLMDPAEVQGLAHFLEHMLFLGTEKYPDVEAYGEYLSQNGGYSNAYTARDHTNYHFQIFPDALEGALDRFSQFFLAPLFTEEFTEREINAVDSEFEKNLESDIWRGFRMLCHKSSPDHPQNSFSTGNGDSLSDVTRDVLIDFYNTYYSANQMALSIVSTHSLDQLEKWTRSMFSEVKSNGREALQYPSDFLEDKPVVRMIKMKSIEDRRKMDIYFNAPGVRSDWDAKSENLIMGMMGYEGQGSLLSSLKEENLATSLGAGTWDESDNYTLSVLGISLTPQGQENPERVLELVFSYIEMLRQSPYPEYLYNEDATMASLRQVYSDKGEGASRATNLANKALRVPLEFAENSSTLYLRQDPDFYYQYLDHMRPDNMLVMISAKDVETTETEAVYGVEYTYSEIGDGLLERLAAPELVAGQTLPNPNPFVPENVELLSERPVLLVDEPGLSLYYGQDNEFQRPKTAMQFKFRVRDQDYTAKDAVLIKFYELLVNEYVNEIGYDALSAELAYSIKAGFEGVSVSAFGYTESARKLLPYLVNALKECEIDQARFDSIKERTVREWNNEKFDNGFLYVRYFTSKASLQTFFLPTEKAAAAADIGLKDVYAFRDRLFKKGSVEALVYGSVSAPEAEEMARSFQGTLGAKPAKKLFENKVIASKPGEKLLFKDTLPTNNSVFRKDYVAGMATPMNRVTAAVLSNLIRTPYYIEMRTKQQLGYVVWSFSFNMEDTTKLGFVIQSGDYDPIDLVGRSDALISTFPDLLKSMPEDAFLKAKAAVRSEIEKKDKTIMEKSARFFGLAYDHAENWSRRDESLAALETLTMEDVVQFLKSTIDPETSQSQLVLLFARQEQELADETEAVTDLNDWKPHQEYREITDL
jgi:insulysin